MNKLTDVAVVILCQLLFLQTEWAWVHTHYRVTETFSAKSLDSRHTVIRRPRLHTTSPTAVRVHAFFNRQTLSKFFLLAITINHDHFHVAKLLKTVSWKIQLSFEPEKKKKIF